MDSWLLQHYNFAEQHCCELSRLSLAYKAQILELQKHVGVTDMDNLMKRKGHRFEHAAIDDEEFDRRTTDPQAVDVAYAKTFLPEVGSGRSSPKVAASVPPTVPTDSFWLGTAPETKLVLAPPRRCGFKTVQDTWGEGEAGGFSVRKPSVTYFKDGQEVEDEDIDSEDELASEANEKFMEMDAARSTSSTLEGAKDFCNDMHRDSNDTREPDSGEDRRKSLASTNSYSAAKQTLVLRQDWSSEEQLSTSVRSGKSGLARCTKLGSVEVDKEIKVLFTRGKSQMRMLGPTKHGFDALVISPTSMRRALLDMLGMLMVAWDVITLPLLAFQFDSTQVAGTASIVTTIFWTLDIGLSFFRGYYDATEMERRFAYTAKKYLRTWFVPDLVLVGVDWVVVVFGTNTAASLRAARIAKAIRLLRMLRMFRLGRIVRFVSLVEDLTSFVFSEMAICTISIAKLFLSLVVFNHLVACGWYAAGSLSQSPERASWVDAYAGKDMLTMYVIAFHWSIAQFTPAPHYVHPENHKERIYAVGVVLFGMLIFSSFLANMTSLITQIRKVSMERSKQQELVRRFLSDHEIPRGLFTRITSFAARHHIFGQKNLMLEQDIHVFSELPEEVRMDLHAELNSPLLLRHPLFGTMAPVYSEFLFKACHYCIKDIILKKDDYLFDTGDQAAAMYVLRTGLADYSWRKPVHSRYLDSTEKAVRVGDWVSEAALWVQWTHVGRLMCRKPCVFMVMNAQEFGKQASRDVQVHSCLRTYAKFFVEKAAQADCMGLNNDIWGNAEERGCDCLREICQQSVDFWEGPIGDHHLQRQGVHLPFSEAVVQQLRGTTLLRRSAE